MKKSDQLKTEILNKVQEYYKAKFVDEIRVATTMKEEDEPIINLAQENNVPIKTICADLLNFDFGENRYDGIVSIFAHFKVEEINKLHYKYFNALKPNGVFMMEVFAKEQLPLKTGGPKDISLLYDTEDIQNSFPAGKIELLKKDIVYLHEGDMHDGKAVVVRSIIRKPS